MRSLEVLVIGAGTMGPCIAQVFACAGHRVTLSDINPDALERAGARIACNLETLVEFDEIAPETATVAQERIRYAGDLKGAAPAADFIVETIPENPQLKREVFEQLDSLCSPDAIISSNTSALNIFDIVHIRNPQRLIIFHWCTPAHIMPLVELVMGPETSSQTLDTCRQLAVELGKKPVIIPRYIPGFIINRLSAAIGREAGHMIEQGWATPEDIDTAICNTFGLRYGFEGHMELFDYIGWDIAYTVTSFLNPQLCASTNYMPLAREMVEKNRLGIKTGRGLKDYGNLNPEEAENIRQRKILKMKQAIGNIRAEETGAEI
ncbi:3-hydroxyacyl-CoA dehydrogenase family protein [Syntrophomonas curvata]